MAAQRDAGGPSSRRPSAAAGATASGMTTSRLDPLPSTHPLSLKIRSVLDSSTAFSSDEKATQRALHELERRYTAREAQPRAKSTAGYQSGATKGEYSQDGRARAKGAHIDTERARRRVDDDAQDALEEACQSYLAVLGRVDEAVAGIGVSIHQLRLTCDSINTGLSTASESAQSILQHATGIRKQRTLTAQNTVILDLFLQRFTLSPTERETITLRAIPVGRPLFAVMDKLKRIREESQVLLVGQEEGVKGGMRAGIDILEETSMLIDSAQQKTAKWLSAEMRSFTREGVDVGDNVRDAIMRLDNREDLLTPVLTTLSSSRAHLLSTSFQRALTVGGPAPTYMPRPIELHAHDPLRYVGDMLAWIHQAVASERDFLTSVFSRIEEGHETVLEGRRRVGQRRRGLEGSIDWTSSDLSELSKAEQWIRRVLDKVLAGCAAPLRVRIEHTVRSQEGCITTFRLASLIQFYRVTMEQTLGTKAAMTITLKDLSILAYRAFIGTLDSVAAGLARFTGLPDDDLSAPPPVLGATATLKELLAVHQASLSEAELYGDTLPLKDLAEHEARDFASVIQRLVEPIHAMCKRMAQAHVERRARSKTEADARWESEIFLANCLSCVKGVAEPFTFMRRTVAQLDREVEEHLDALTLAHHQRLLRESGLRPIASEEGGNPPVQVFEKAFADLEVFLASPTLLSSPQLGLLGSPSMRALVHARALEGIAQDYEQVAKRTASLPPLASAQGELPTPPLQSHMPRRDVDQVRLLLGIDKNQDEPSSS